MQCHLHGHGSPLCSPPFPLSTLFISPPFKRGVPTEIACHSFSPRSSLFNARLAVFGCSSLFRLIRSCSTHSKDNVGSTRFAKQTQPFSSPSISQSQRYDVSGMACKGHCTVFWSILADIADGSVIYVTGDAAQFGCWHPHLAIPFSRSLHTTNLWETQIQVPWGINFKYNYIKRHTSSAIEWRSGPECSLSVPFPTGENEVISVRDCWMRESIHRFPPPSWGSWLADSGFTEVTVTHSFQQALSSGEHKILENQNGSTRKDDHIIIQANDHGCINILGSKLQRESDGPIEEPWLIDSRLLKLSSLLQEQTEVEEEHTDAVPARPPREVDAGSTVILVNSSVCTTQRIAILEEGKLVELLLEPVKNEVDVTNKVQLDSIYLGVITHLVPHMQGAFVDIGIKKPSFMGISRYRKPFVFPTAEKDEEGEDEFAEDVEVGDAHIADSVLERLQGRNNRKVKKNQWINVKEGAKIIVQVVKEELRTKGPSLTPYPNLRSRFWVLKARSDVIDVSSIIHGSERNLLKLRAKMLQPPGFGLTVRTVAEGHSLEELQEDLDGLLLTWKEITERAKSAALAADKGIEGAVPVMLHGSMGQTLSVVQDFFNEKVKSMVVDSPHTYDEIMQYLEKVAPELCKRVELYDKRTPIFDEYKIEEEINNILSTRVALPNGGSLVIEQTKALVSIDVNAGSSAFEEGISIERAALDINLFAAKQVARELRLRDIGGIIVVDFIEMPYNSSKWKVYEEMKKAVKQDRSIVDVHEPSDLSLMVRPSVSFMISDPCICCQGDGHVEALEICYMKIENEIRCLLATLNERPDPQNPKTWPKFELLVDEHMKYYLTSGNTKLSVFSVSINVQISLKLIGTFPRGKFELIRVMENKETNRI